MRTILILGFCAVLVLSAAGADLPAADAFRVLPPPSAEAPVITPYLKYQTEMAWQQDDLRRKSWEAIRTEQDLLRIQTEVRANLLSMLGGLPAHKTPLNPHITGKIQMDGFHIEKLIFESLPGVYVSALVYLPDDESKKHPGMLVPEGHSSNETVHYQSIWILLVWRGYVLLSCDRFVHRQQ